MARGDWCNDSVVPSRPPFVQRQPSSCAASSRESRAFVGGRVEGVFRVDCGCAFGSIGDLPGGTWRRKGGHGPRVCGIRTQEPPQSCGCHQRDSQGRCFQADARSDHRLGAKVEGITDDSSMSRLTHRMTCTSPVKTGLFSTSRKFSSSSSISLRMRSTTSADAVDAFR